MTLFVSIIFTNFVSNSFVVMAKMSRHVPMQGSVVNRLDSPAANCPQGDSECRRAKEEGEDMEWMRMAGRVLGQFLSDRRREGDGKEEEPARKRGGILMYPRQMKRADYRLMR